MKFLCNFRNTLIDDSFFVVYNHKIINKYLKFKYLLKKIKSRKNISNIRPGVSLNFKKNSIKRDKNLSLLNQFINLNNKKGKKFTIFKNINFMFFNLIDFLNYDLEEFKHYKYYDFLVYSFNNNLNFSNLDSLLDFSISGLESIFEIKTSKNNKKLKLKTKYSHEIIYIPKERRLKYVLKSLSFYKEHFKKYNLWERFFWCFLITLINKDNSFLKKKREFIYIKSIKFFKKKINK